MRFVFPFLQDFKHILQPPPFFLQKRTSALTQVQTFWWGGTVEATTCKLSLCIQTTLNQASVTTRWSTKAGGHFCRPQSSLLNTHPIPCEISYNLWGQTPRQPNTGFLPNARACVANAASETEQMQGCWQKQNCIHSS